VADSPQLDRRITVLSPTTTRDAAGGVVLTYGTYGTAWCNRMDKGSREFGFAGTTVDETTVIFRTRWSSSLAAITGDYRISHEGREFAVTAPTREVGRRQFLLIEAKERKGR